MNFLKETSCNRLKAMFFLAKNSVFTKLGLIYAFTLLELLCMIIQLLRRNARCLAVSCFLVRSSQSEQVV